MKKFIRNILLYFLLTCVTMMVIALVMPKNRNAYLYAQRNKMERLDTLPSPRLIFAGGCNTAFTLDSRMIGDSLNTNVSNTGLIIFLGLRYVLDQTEKHVRPGDKVVIMAEYWHFFGDNYLGEPEAILPVEIYTDFSGFPTLTPSQIMQLPLALPHYLLINSTPAERGVGTWSSLNFNEFGDDVTHLDYDGPSIKIEPDHIGEEIGKPLSQQACRDVAEHIRRMRKAGAEVYLLPGACTRSYYLYNKRSVDQLYAAMEREGEPFLLEPEALTLPDSMGYDNPSHFNREGVEMMSRRIIRFLSKTP